MSASAYDREARELHHQLWRMREVGEMPWHLISDRLRIAQPRLAKIRKAALELALADTQTNGRVRWRAPDAV